MNTKDELKAFEEAVFSDIEQWEDGSLGADITFVKKSTQSKSIRSALSKINAHQKEKTQLISMRLPVSLIEDLKEIGLNEGLGYQTLAKTVLQRFADAEKRKLYNEMLSKNRKLEMKVEELSEEIKQLKQA